MKASQAHTVWRFLANPNALSVNLLTQKYLKTTSFSEYKVRPLDSNTWKMIVRNITILLDNKKWVVDNGANIRLFKYYWIPQIGTPPIPTNLCSLDQLSTLATVADLTIEIKGWTQWNHNLIIHLWDRDTAELIIQLPLGGSDIRGWGNNLAGNCVLKSLYHDLSHSPIVPHYPWRDLWKLDLPANLKLFLWRVILDFLPTNSFRNLISPTNEPIFVLSRIEIETPCHLFSKCPITARIWDSLPHTIPRLYHYPTFAV